MKNLSKMLLLTAILLVGSGTALFATRVLQMNLERLCQDAERVFRGTVVSIEETRVAVGGGELPALVYKFRVNETFKGSFETVKDVQVAEVRMVGSLKQHAKGIAPIPGFPLLRQGGDYLIMVAPAGPVGLTTSMGLGQGVFSISGRDESRVAVNGANNSGLFAGMATTNMPASGAVSYDELAGTIRGILGGSN